MTASATDARDAALPARPARLLSGIDTVCELLVARAGSKLSRARIGRDSGSGSS